MIISRLLVTLNQSKIASENNALYQVIKGIIEQLLNNDVNTLDVSYLTFRNDRNVLINSRQLIAGTNITFDENFPNRIVINAVLPEPPIDKEWSVLTNGTDELIFANGDVIMVHVP